MKIDLLDPASFSAGHPHAQYQWLRDNAPVYWHEEPNGRGFWAVTRYAEVDATGRDPGTFSSEPTIMIEDPASGTAFAFGDHKMMLMMDPPAHTHFRKIISREFTQGPAQTLRPRVEVLARQIIDMTGSKSKMVFAPLPEDDPRQRQPDITLAKNQLAWQPEVSLEQGLERTIAYFERLLRGGAGGD